MYVSTHTSSFHMVHMFLFPLLSEDHSTVVLVMCPGLITYRGGSTRGEIRIAITHQRLNASSMGSSLR